MRKTVGLWVLFLPRGLSEGLPTALTCPLRSQSTIHFWMYPGGFHAVPAVWHLKQSKHMTPGDRCDGRDQPQ